MLPLLFQEKLQATYIKKNYFKPASNLKILVLSVDFKHMNQKI